MSKEKRRVPKLRFPGFTEDWEQRKLGDLMEVTSVKRIHQADWTDSGVRFFRARDIVSSMNNEEVDNPVFISEDKYEEYSRISGKVIEGDLLVTGVGTIGVPYLIKDSTPLYFKDGNIIWFKNNNILNGEYFYYCFQNNSIQSQIYSASGKGTVGTYTIENGKKTSISYPSLKEQVKIGKLLDTMAIMITLHQRKLEHLNLKKKALLQKLFPKNGERYPELRFPGFTDAWEQRKLGSIGSTYTGLSGKTKEDFGHGEAQYITYLNVFQNTVSDITMTDKVEVDTTQNEVKYGDVLFTTSSETPEEVGMSSVWLGHMPNIYLNSFCFGFRPNQKIDPYFLGYSLRAPYMRDKIKILAQGISRYNISKNKVMELEISLPNNEEQRLLGNFLRNIDLSITLHQRKLEHLQLQKKSLLQQMFV